MTAREKVLRNLGALPELARQASEGSRRERLKALKELRRRAYPHRRDSMGRTLGTSHESS